LITIVYKLYVKGQCFRDEVQTQPEETAEDLSYDKVTADKSVPTNQLSLMVDVSNK
jgi:hypothetical protein